MSKLIKWDPFQEFADIQNRLTSLFKQENGERGGTDLLSSTDWAPAVDVSEDDNEYLITADLPDVKKDEVKVELENGTLTITGERTREKKEKDKKKKYHRVERSYGRYSRAFHVPDDVATDNVVASFKDGVLKVHLPKCEKKKPKSVKVKVA